MFSCAFLVIVDLLPLVSESEAIRIFLITESENDVFLPLTFIRRFSFLHQEYALSSTLVGSLNPLSVSVLLWDVRTELRLLVHDVQ